ncbi:MAG: DNA repair protein RecO [Rhodocyclaceae bacterium]|nr:DNA repair protein RecO [Rhodocyclaceae bacterium]
MKQRFDNQRAYLLHTYPYSETSLIADVFSREHGRIPMLAKGARRPRSALRGVLIGFQPLELGWFGGGDVKTLAKAEWVGGVPLLRGRCLLLGYYLNELLIRLLPREDAHAILFDAYEEALATLAAGTADAPELRRFEKALLREIGYGLTLDKDVRGQAIRPEAHYLFYPERGPIEATADESAPTLAGKTLLDLAADDYRDPRTLAESKGLMRQLMAHHLNGQTLQSRRVFIELQEF